MNFKTKQKKGKQLKKSKDAQIQQTFQINQNKIHPQQDSDRSAKIINIQSNELELEDLTIQQQEPQRQNANDPQQPQAQQMVSEEIDFSMSPIKINDNIRRQFHRNSQLIYPENKTFLRKEQITWLNYFCNMVNCRGQSYFIDNSYMIQVSYDRIKLLCCGQYKIEITDTKPEQLQYEIWDVSYQFWYRRWNINNTESQIKIVYNHPYFIIQDYKAQKQYKYTFKKPLLCQDAKLLNENIIIAEFSTKDYVVSMNLDEEQRKFLIPIVVFIDQQNLNVDI